MALTVLKREYDHHTEQIHAVGGPSVRDVMLGLNDGLVASFAVTSGVAGAFARRLLRSWRDFRKCWEVRSRWDWRRMPLRERSSSSSRERSGANATKSRGGLVVSAPKSVPYTARRASVVRYSIKS
jgi:hypothetical protein